MDLQDLSIARVVLHEVHKRTNERDRVPPTYGDALEHLQGNALDAFRERVVAAMGRTDRCVQMDIMAGCPMIPIADDIVGSATDAQFLERSRQVADALADAQTRRDLPGGIVVVFSGTVGVPERRFFAVIKAETHNGFIRERDARGRLGLRFLDKLLLTPQTKLYKIGMYIEAAPGQEGEERWRAFIYDDGMSPRDRYGAAQYFYESFLGLAFMESSARETKAFHDLTRSFIAAIDAPQEDKVVLHNALVTYLQGAVSPTVNVRTFADAYFGDNTIHDSYTSFMYDRGFPRNAVNKDLSDIKSALRLRKLVFRKQVRITAPAEVFSDLIRIEAIEGDRQADGSRARWTRVTIKDEIASQE